MASGSEAWVEVEIPGYWLFYLTMMHVHGVYVYGKWRVRVRVALALFCFVLDMHGKIQDARSLLMTILATWQFQLGNCRLVQPKVALGIHNPPFVCAHFAFASVLDLGVHLAPALCLTASALALA